MFKEKRSLHLIFLILFFIFIIIAFTYMFGPSYTESQYWAMMPPYNVLWPLWSPVLSPIDPLTGLNTPLVSTLTANTLLPVQPALAWDPCQPAPWPLYNAPLAFGGGLLFFDVAYGLNKWPPAYLTDPITGAPSPITYITTLWPAFLPTSLGHLEFLIPTANLAYGLTYGITGPTFLDLLTAADIWGLPPI